MCSIAEQIYAIVAAVIAVAVLIATAVGLLSIDFAPAQTMGAAILLGLLFVGYLVYAKAIG